MKLITINIYRRISSKHLVEHKWLAYSESMKEYFCKFCAILHCEGNSVGRGAQKAGKLVTTSLVSVSYNKLTGKTGDLTMHENTVYHKACIKDGLNLCHASNDPAKDIRNQVSAQRNDQVGKPIR